MKKSMISYSIIVICIFTTFSSFVPVVFAGGNQDSPVELKYIGTHHKKAVLRLKLNNSSEGEYLIRVRDGDKTLLFSERLKGKNITRKYQADADDSSFLNGTTFEVINVVTKETSLYSIQYNTSFVENTLITKL